MKNKTILITGVNGFIGKRAAELAHLQGLNVRGLQRSESKAVEPGIERITGDITNSVAAQKACQGVDIVLHTAAIVKETGSIKTFREVNVEGALNMALAAKKAGVKTFVHLSSVMVYGFNYPKHVTENGPLRGENNAYCQSKIEAEKELLKLNDSPNFGVIIIRPGDVYGPGSIPWIVRPLQLMRKKLFVYANGGRGVINHVYIDNLIDAIFLAIEKEAYGEIFNITDGQETSWKEYFSRLAEIAGIGRHEYLSISKKQLKFLINLHNQQQKLFGQQLDILPESIDFITRPHAYSIAKAQTMLNYKPKVDIKEGMQRTQEWLQKVDIHQYQ